MKDTSFSDKILYIGCDDRDLDLFENQYQVPNGMSYNSYVIMDEKIAIMDTVDARAVDEWMKKLECALDGRRPDYLIVQHLEPDHSAGIETVCKKYPDLEIVTSAKSAAMFPQFFTMDFSGRMTAVKEGDTLSLGAHVLTFIMAPMVHWPEVMVSYESAEKVLFSADGFGKFGTLDTEEEWDCEARRYYFNIVGKYGAPVQILLKKASALDISVIAPLHGPVLTEDLQHYIGKYQIWSSYRPEDSGVTIACASIHGKTLEAARKLQELLTAKGVKAELFDLTRCDKAEAVEDAFRYDRLVLAASSYDGGVFLPMENFLCTLVAKGYQNRKVAILENGSWAPCAAKVMKTYLDRMKDIRLCDTVVTIKSTFKDADLPALERMAEELTIPQFQIG